MYKSRKLFRALSLATCLTGLAGTPQAHASQWPAMGPALTEVARLDWLCNAVALTSDGRLFVGLPRWPGFEKTPSIAEVMPDGTLKPFPGGQWNDWAPGKPSAEIGRAHV